MSKKERILQAALNITEERDSFPQFTVLEVAERADIGKGTVYEYFSNKEELLEQMREYCVERMVGHIENALLAPGDIKDKIRVLLSRAAQLNAKSGDYLFTRVKTIMSLFDGADCADKKFEAYKKRGEEAFIKLVNFGAADTSRPLRRVDYLRAFSAMSAAMLMIMLWRKNQADVSFEELLDAACEQAVKGF